MRVIVCGSRTKEQLTVMEQALVRGLAAMYGRALTVVHGDCKGLDRAVADYAEGCGIRTEAVAPDWRSYGRAAGPIRNQEMLDMGADMVVAFKEPFDWAFRKGGTEDMVRRARDAGVPCWVVQRPLTDLVLRLWAEAEQRNGR